MRILLALGLLALMPARAAAREITVSGTTFRLDGASFPYTGISFFNAIYNPADRKSTRLNSSHSRASRMPSSA